MSSPKYADQVLIKIYDSLTNSIRVLLEGGITPNPGSTGSMANNAAIGGSAITFSAPVNTLGFILEAESTNSANLRWCIGATASSSVGMLLEPGRDTGFIPCSGDLSVIALSATQAASVQWILK